MTSVISQSADGDRNLAPEVCLVVLEKMLKMMSLSKQRQPKVLVLSPWGTTFFKNVRHPN